MKNKLIILFGFILVVWGGIAGYQHTKNVPSSTTPVININVNDIKISKKYLKIAKMKPFFADKGYSTVFSDKGNFKSGKFNLYVADEQSEIPTVLDKNAINILWLPMFSDGDDLKRLRQFDVIVVKSMKAFNHLKAINVRTAYIPEAIDVAKPMDRQPQKDFMYFGDNNEFSPALYLSGKHNFKVDIFGKGFEYKWPKEEIKADAPLKDDFSKYKLVMIDQTEQEVVNELINPRIIETLENGAIPLIRYNFGIYRIFGDALPYYNSEEEFQQNIDNYTSENILSAKHKIYHISQNWNTQSQVYKFIELFEIMEKKLR